MPMAVEICQKFWSKAYNIQLCSISPVQYIYLFIYTSIVMFLGSGAHDAG
jgi:hypothetical protein